MCMFWIMWILWLIETRVGGIDNGYMWVVLIRDI